MLLGIGQQLGRDWRPTAVAATSRCDRGTVHFFPAALPPYLSVVAYEQVAKVAAAQPTTAEGFIELVKQEEPATTVQPGIVADADLANVVYTIPGK